MYKKAEALVRSKMTDVRNDGKTPSWQHPLDVVGVVREVLSTVHPQSHSYEVERMEVVALLHDIVEDSDVTLNEVNKEFSWDVRCDVMYLTKSDTCRFGTPELVEYFHRLMTQASPECRIVKCCDRIANLREVEGVFKPYRLERYKFETKMFVIPIAMTLPEALSKRLVNKLSSLSIAASEPQKKSA